MKMTPFTSLVDDVDERSVVFTNAIIEEFCSPEQRSNRVIVLSFVRPEQEIYRVGVQ